MAGKLTRKPAGQAAPSVDDFISGAGQQGQVSSGFISYDTVSYPWNRHYHKPIKFIFIDTRHKQAYYSIINTVYRYAPILRLDVGRMIDNKHMTDLEAVSNYRG